MSKNKIMVIKILCIFIIPIIIFLELIHFNSNYLITNIISIILLIIGLAAICFIIYSFYDKHKNKDAYYNLSKKLKIIIITFLLVCDIFLCTFSCLLYLPNSKFKTFLITSAMTTFSHQYLARWFYNDEIINNVMNNNKVIESDISTNANLINFKRNKLSNKIYKNKYEKDILDRDEKALYKIIDISGDGYKGKIVAIYDASKISVVPAKYMGNSGEMLTSISKNNNAIIAMNASGFYDPGYVSNGGEPLGMVISNNKLLIDKIKPGVGGGLIGFDKDNRLILSSTINSSQALKMGIRDAIEFGPFLIVNGVPAYIKGDGGWGVAPRSAIAQRKDGIVLFLVVDGRDYVNGILGMSMSKMTEVLMNYGAYNAANLDGGTSSGLTLNHELINNPVNAYGQKRTRPIPNAWILKE